MALYVSQIMRRKVVYCERSTSLKKVAESILAEDIWSVLVKKGEESVGIITTNDLLRAVLKGKDFDKTGAGETMTHPLETCDSGQTLEQVLNKFEETGRSRLVVTKEGKVVGVLGRAIAERFKGVKGIYKFSPVTRSLPFRRG